jgi:excisionase family DNA binding protein
VPATGPVAMLTIEEVAAIFQVQARTIRVWCMEGKLEYVKFGRKTLRFKPQWLDEFVERQQRGVRRKSS